MQCAAASGVSIAQQTQPSYAILKGRTSRNCPLVRCTSPTVSRTKPSRVGNTCQRATGVKVGQREHTAEVYAHHQWKQSKDTCKKAQPGDYIDQDPKIAAYERAQSCWRVVLQDVCTSEPDQSPSSGQNRQLIQHAHLTGSQDQRRHSWQG